MLVLSRKVGEQLVVPQCQVTVTVLNVSSGRVRLGISAPTNIVVHRSKVRQRIEAHNGPQEPESMTGLRVLFADPDDFLVAKYREELARHEAIVATAASGLKCIEHLRSFAPDVLVLDPTLRWGGGDGVLALIEEEPEIGPAAVILLTPGGNRSLVYRLSSFRVDDYLTKPVSPRQLLKRLCTLLMAYRIDPGRLSTLRRPAPQATEP